MTDITSHSPPRRHASRHRTVEFWFYFTIIFVLALPTSTISWTRDLLRHRTLNLRGPMARAWAEADCVTPLIFSV